VKKGLIFAILATIPKLFCSTFSASLDGLAGCHTMTEGISAIVVIGMIYVVPPHLQ